jgi:ABC-type uncharacterized transport system involved in gliding motility auxiliary subunit
MRRFTEFAEKYGFILGYLALAALLAGAARYLIGHVVDDWVKGLLIGGAAAGVLYAVLLVLLRPEQARAALTGRTARYGSNAVAMSIAFVGILIGLNYLAGRYHYRYDATELKEHTLSDQSIQILAEIDQPVTIIGFFAANDYRKANFDELLGQYLDQNSQLSYTVIDPDREPIRAQQYEPVPYSGLLLQSGGREERVYTADEQDITSAILKVTREGKKVIYFLNGHQERDPEGYAEDGYSTVADALREQNYEVRTLNLAVTATVPSDAAVVVVAGPQVELLDYEQTRLQMYLASGGKALIMQDPFNEAGLNDVLSAWQVRFGEGVVIDAASSLMGSAAAPAVARYRSGQITKDLPATFFPLARPVEQTAEDSTGSITFSPLAETTPQSWAEQDTESPEAGFDEAMDTPGPLTLVATVESPLPADPNVKTRLVLIGDSDFATNEFVEGLGNQWLFLIAVNWLAQEESLIAIGPKGSQPHPLYLSGFQSILIVVVGVVLIPLALLISGIVVWWRRR